MRTRIHLPATKTSKTTRDTTQKQKRSEALPLRYIGHLNKLFSGIRKQVNHTHRKPRHAITHNPGNTHLFLSGYRKDPPLCPRLKTTHLIFPGNRERSSRTQTQRRHYPIHGEEQPERNPGQTQTRTGTVAISLTHHYPGRERKFLNSRERHYFICGEQLKRPTAITHTSISSRKRREKRTCHYSIHGEEHSPKRREHPRRKHREEPLQEQRNHIRR